ncbi:MAG: isoprenylcysteine carboxylmethyltransferase family protein [Planctomycetaceae bacterium]|nr:isoprenylcysteine carboxylmethyltransferase family protein [Planctomycetales bacterium]MCB9874802.1 isoprenylcysteine carboxylmethyltransferase family protein [Planctomycetaceae bacterium]HRX79156.1 isoprenylcysteine carboxylmethyltransferase family protein [Pirellulaceae bacterium]
MPGVRPFYRLLVRRRVPISFVLFSSILITEALLGVGWHHVNLGSDLIFGTAITVVLLGMGIRSWAAGTIRKNAELAISGPYSLCRHPLYLGSFLMIIGFCLGTQPLINLPIVAPCVIVIYACSIRNEEGYLHQIFGQAWQAYSAATPRLIPNVLRPKLLNSSWSAAQWQQNREYQAVFGALMGIAGMFAWYVMG